MHGLISTGRIRLILFRYANYMGYDTSARGDLSDYADGALTSEYAWEAMEWAVGAGILGQSVENLNPLGYVNRAEDCRDDQPVYKFIWHYVK